MVATSVRETQAALSITTVLSLESAHGVQAVPQLISLGSTLGCLASLDGSSLMLMKTEQTIDSVKKITVKS